MSENIIFITHYDAKRIGLLSRSALEFEQPTRRLLKKLNDKLHKAVRLPPQAIPENVITLDSRLRLKDLVTGEERTYTLVMPGQANIQEQRISVLSPLGASIFGHVSGDTVDCETPDGWRRLTVGRILYQPEAWGLDLA